MAIISGENAHTDFSATWQPIRLLCQKHVNETHCFQIVYSFASLQHLLNPVFAFVSGQLLTVLFHINEFVCKITKKMFLSFL